MHQQVRCTRKKMISLGSRLITCCKLAPTLARQIWRYNYIIDHNEYLIYTLSESINPWVYSLQFLFKSINNTWRYERKCEWVFFFWTQCMYRLGWYCWPFFQLQYSWWKWHSQPLYVKLSCKRYAILRQLLLNINRKLHIGCRTLIVSIVDC